MKNRFTKLAVFTVLVSLLGSTLLMGCGSKDDDSGAANTTNAAPKKDDAP